MAYAEDLGGQSGDLENSLTLVDQSREWLMKSAAEFYELPSAGTLTKLETARMIIARRFSMLVNTVVISEESVEVKLALIRGLLNSEEELRADGLNNIAMRPVVSPATQEMFTDQQVEVLEAAGSRGLAVLSGAVADVHESNMRYDLKQFIEATP
jgi:hypothetical protein